LPVGVFAQPQGQGMFIGGAVFSNEHPLILPLFFFLGGF
jgi:hypothetical protein